jgi:hypothetical protein
MSFETLCSCVLMLTTGTPSSSPPSACFLFLAGCFAAWCPCIVFSRNRQHLRSLQYQGIPLPAASETNDDQCCIYCGLETAGYGWVMQVRFSEDVDVMRSWLIRVLGPRFASVKKCASAMASVAVRLMIAASPRGAALVLSSRSAGRLSWRKEVSSELKGAQASFLTCYPKNHPSLRRRSY